jgi:hypothetical protein
MLLRILFSVLIEPYLGTLVYFYYHNSYLYWFFLSFPLTKTKRKEDQSEYYFFLVSSLFPEASRNSLVPSNCGLSAIYYMIWRERKKVWKTCNVCMYVRGDYSIRPKSTASNEEKRGQKKETKIKSRSKQLIIIVSQFIYVIPHTPGPHMPKIIGQKKTPPNAT